MVTDANKLQEGGCYRGILQYYIVVVTPSVLLYSKLQILAIIDNSQNNGDVLEVCYNGVWKPVCGEHWSNGNATEACKQLGFRNSSCRLYTNIHAKLSHTF